MPAPAPRSRLSNGGSGDGVNGSPMDTGDVVDFSAISAEIESGKGDEGRCVRLIEKNGLKIMKIDLFLFPFERVQQ